MNKTFAYLKTFNYLANVLPNLEYKLDGYSTYKGWKLGNCSTKT
jgi:hypothetical protein